MCEYCKKKYDAYKTSMRVIQQVDNVLMDIIQPTFSEASQSSKDWTTAVAENEFIDLKAIAKREKKSQKAREKVFKWWKTRFLEGVKAKQSGGLFGFFSKKKKELTQAERDDILSAMFDEEEIEELYYELYVAGEMPEDHRYAVDQIAKKKNILTDPLMYIVVWYLLEEYSDFSKKLCNSMVDNAKVQINNIIIYSVEQWKTTKEISDAVVSKVDNYIKKESKRVAITETMRAVNKWLESWFERMWVKYYEVLHSIDACPLCVDIAVNWPYETLDKIWMPPFHPHCRCAIVPLLK